MRNAFAGDITKYAFEDDRITLLSGDVGNRLFNVFKQLQPDQFMNCGVAEANMMSMAGGMALSGLRPFVYSITPFLTTRCVEQIRLDLSYHDVPATIVGVGAGLSYAGCGPTHHACEDIAMLRSLPNMKVVCPGDAMEVRALLKEILAQDGPVYFRIGKKNEPVIHDDVPDLTIGEGHVVKEGQEICLLNTGNTLPVATNGARQLESEGISTRVVSLHTVKPLDEQLLAECFRNFQLVATVEEHSRLGGLGGAVAEWVADQNFKKRANLIRFDTDDSYLSESADVKYAREKFGLTPENIAAKCKQKIRN